MLLKVIPDLALWILYKLLRAALYACKQNKGHNNL